MPAECQYEVFVLPLALFLLDYAKVFLEVAPTCE